MSGASRLTFYETMILVNNRDKIQWEKGMTVARLLQVCHFTARQIAVFVDGELVRRETYATHPVKDRAEVKVLHFIGGG